MIEPPKIVQTAKQITAGIHIVVPREKIQEVMGPAIGELFAALAAQGVAPAGPLLSHHVCNPTDVFNFDICIPVTKPVTPAGRMKPGELPAVRAARTVYHGEYEGLGAAWGALGEWIESNGQKPAENLWECYITGPESGPDSSKWRTELNRPLV